MRPGNTFDLGREQDVRPVRMSKLYSPCRISAARLRPGSRVSPGPASANSTSGNSGRCRLAGNWRNAHAAHQRVHGYFEAGDATGGIAFIEAWLADYPRAGHLHFHLSWHLALF